MTRIDLRTRVHEEAERRQVIDAALTYLEAAVVFWERQRASQSRVSMPVAFDLTETRSTLPRAVVDGLSDQDLARALLDTAYLFLREQLRDNA